MNLALFYDCDTTGLPLFKEPSEDPRQPHLVQLAACLVNIETQTTVASMDVIIRPRNFEIPESVTAIHGISTEYAKRVGISESMAVEIILEFWVRSDLRIGHNEAFDARIVRIAMMRHGNYIGRVPDDWKGGIAECTQTLSTPIVKLPPTANMIAAGRRNYKSPSLREAYQYFTGNELLGAHNAMVDVQACMSVLFAIRALREKAQPIPNE